MALKRGLLYDQPRSIARQAAYSGNSLNMYGRRRLANRPSKLQQGGCDTWRYRVHPESPAVSDPGPQPRVIY